MDELDMMRFKLIKEMSKAELIEELIAGWRIQLTEETPDNLKRAVIKYRTGAVQQRLIAEAELEPTGLYGEL